MITNEFAAKAREDLRYVYNAILNDEVDEEFVKQVYNEYIHASTLLPDEMINAVSRLYPIAYPDVKSSLKYPTKEHAEEFLKTI